VGRDHDQVNAAVRRFLATFFAGVSATKHGIGWNILPPNESDCLGQLLAPGLLGRFSFRLISLASQQTLDYARILARSFGAEITLLPSCANIAPNIPR